MSDFFPVNSKIETRGGGQGVFAQVNKIIIWLFISFTYRHTL